MLRPSSLDPPRSTRPRIASTTAMMGSDDVALLARVALVDCEDAVKWDDHLDVWCELPRGHPGSTMYARAPLQCRAALPPRCQPCHVADPPGAAAARLEGATRWRARGAGPGWSGCGAIMRARASCPAARSSTRWTPSSSLARITRPCPATAVYTSRRREVTSFCCTPLPYVGVSIGMGRGCQQNDSLADG